MLIVEARRGRNHLQNKVPDAIDLTLTVCVLVCVLVVIENGIRCCLKIAVWHCD